VITVIPRHLDKPHLRQTEERDTSIGEAGDVSIGDLHPTTLAKPRACHKEMEKRPPVNLLVPPRG